jgi:hypothetical protein
MDKPALGEAPGLYIEVNPTPGLEVDEDQIERHCLSPLVIGLNCEYLPAEGDWETEWVDETTLPIAVRVGLTLQDQAGKEKPVTLVSTTNLAMATLPTGGESSETQ